MKQMSEVTEPTSYSIISFPAKELPENYRSLIFSKWMRSLRFGNPLFERVNSDDYYQNYQKYIENLLSKPDSIVRLAVVSDDHDVVLGFAVSREDVLDYVHVHKDNRRLGIGKDLVPKHITTFTHVTKTILNILKPIPHTQSFEFKDWKLKFNPFA